MNTEDSSLRRCDAAQ